MVERTLGVGMGALEQLDDLRGAFEFLGFGFAHSRQKPDRQGGQPANLALADARASDTVAYERNQIATERTN